MPAQRCVCGHVTPPCVEPPEGVACCPTCRHRTIKPIRTQIQMDGRGKGGILFTNYHSHTHTHDRAAKQQTAGGWVREQRRYKSNAHMAVLTCRACGGPRSRTSFPAQRPEGPSRSLSEVKENRSCRRRGGRSVRTAGSGCRRSRATPILAKVTLVFKA